MSISKKDVTLIGDEMVRIVEPIYKRFDEMDRRFDEIDREIKSIKRLLQEHTDKIDALMAEMHDLHQQMGIFQDKINAKIEKIQKFVGIPN